MRRSGILLPVASLPGKYGIGTMGKEAYKFIDNLAAAGQSYWQILPLGPTGYGDSPYQSFSTFAGNPYLIDLDILIEEGLLTRRECNSADLGDREDCIDYEKMFFERYPLLIKAFTRSDITEDPDYQEFCQKNASWLYDYALYMAVKDSFEGVSFIEWDEDIRTRQPEALEEYRGEYAEEIEFYMFLQYKFHKQWFALKKYANDKGVRIIGDIPIYVAFDSADTWSNPELFQFDKDGYPIGVAGCPPDGFSPTGQLWGNPLYNWNYHKKTGFKWWISRIKHCMELYDRVRIDHFRAFDEYYFIPYGHETAEHGRWVQGPGLELFEAVRKHLGDVDMIAEDLGFLTDSVLELVKESGFPGMKVLQFAFDSREDSDYLPHNYIRNSVVYTGTHDNDTTVNWFKNLNREDRRMAEDYLNKYSFADNEDISWAFIKLAMSSVSDTCIIPMQDYLALGKEGRINTPSTLGNNWTWRMDRKAFSKKLIRQIKDITGLYARLA